MTRDITEADWKVFTKLKSTALDRFCAQAVARVAEIAGDAQRSNHERLLDVFAHVRDANKELARLFDGHSRSQAPLQLFLLVRHGLLTPEELSRLSAPLREELRQGRLAMRSNLGGPDGVPISERYG